MKKLLSILLVLVLCTGLMAMTVSAEETEEATPKFYVSSHELKEGTKEVTVTVTMDSPTKFSVLTVGLEWDTSVLELVNGTDVPFDENADPSEWVVAPCWSSNIAWAWGYNDNAFLMNLLPQDCNGTIATLKFKVLKDDLQGQSVTVKANYGGAYSESKTYEGAAVGTIKFLCEHKSGTDAVTVTPATCEEAGKIEHVCKKCGEVTKTETVKALGHTKGEAVTENEVAATCETAGSKDTVVYCTVCEKEVSRKTETVKALGHTKGEAVTENEVAATCETAGSKDTVVYCTVCEKEISRKTETTKAIGHKWDNGKVTGEAKCGEPGEMTYTCQNDATHTRTEKMDALAHILDEGKETTAPSCTDKGVMTYTCTLGCGHTETKDIPALGHTDAEAVKENEVAPTCTEKGSYDEVVYCSVCQTELTRKTVSVDAIGHDWDEGVVTVEPTCTKEGEKLHNCKNGCGETMTSVVEKAKHTVKEGTVEADDNLCVYTCAVCNQAVEHTHDKTGLTTSEDGKYLVGTCAHCGGEVKFTIPPSGDITPMLIMGGVAVFSMLAAAAYVTCRKFAK